MAVRSAGLLLVRRARVLEVYLAHLGGPFWARKTEGAWSIPKGEVEPGEDEAAAARREFAEEIGAAPPASPLVDLGEVRYSSGKVVHVFALEVDDFGVDRVVSNEFELEWPPRSGRRQRFPEIDDAGWFGLDAARPLLSSGQRPALDLVAQRFGNEGLSTP
ncbi:NUDIX domain-containing protein [Agromyces intestinalis]|uniref:NUDIX domain-containing protein n=1 Tax=Agromyces intestinalis TaxID=2592652 RepID=A0A5C1YCN8_9MICO|nr:NUDIX domain-containing protein [Agromyces intestinalis]QEO13766.1 NUDIX domain-containing protein [Agromyces intestinalis]